MVKTVLVYSLGDLLGDGVYKLPWLTALAEGFPGADITWFAGAETGPDAVGTSFSGPLKFIADQYIKDVMVDDVSGPHFARSALNFSPFHGRKFDVVIDTQTRIGRAMVARRAATSLFVSSAADGFLSMRKPSEPLPIAVTARVHRLIELAAGRALPNHLPSIVDDRMRAAAKALLPDGPRYVGFSPGAGGTYKRWPLERFIIIAKHFVTQGITPVFLVGPAELEFLPIIRAGVPTALLPEHDRTDDFLDVKGPRLAFALAERFAASVACDSGIGHVLATGGQPLITIFPDHRMQVKFPTLAANTILLAGEDFGAAHVDSVPVEAVITKLRQVLAGTNT